MRPEEIRALGDLAGDAVAGTALQIQEVHSGIARRVWRLVGPASLPVRLAHDAIAAGTYTAARELGRVAVRAGGLAVSLLQAEDAQSIEQSPIGRAVVGALNGAFGDTLDRRGNRLAMRMAVRQGGHDVELEPAALRRAFSHPTSRLAVFLHGLGQTDDAWMLGADRHIPYGYRLQAELGYTPVYIRYNSGRHISENGHGLAALLSRLHASWPSEVHEIALLGHNMGGLVARSACHYGAGDPWAKKVRHVFTLGAPHGGMPLERAADAASAALARLPETRGIAMALNLRSVGMKDLRYGYLVDEDWREQESGARLPQIAREIPFLKTAHHYFVSATLSSQPDAPVGRAVGDLLVVRPSAWALRRRGERLRFPVDHYHHLGGAHHLQLLNHPAIYAQIRRWLTSRPALPAPRHELPPPSGGAQRP